MKEWIIFFKINFIIYYHLKVPQQTTTTSSSKSETTTVDSSIYSLPPTSTKQPSKLQQMSSKPGKIVTNLLDQVYYMLFL